MNRTGWQDLKERVKQTTDLVQLVGQSIRLERRGRMFLGLCPWHTDSRPSLQVQPDRQTWKCWVCNLGGDCFSFVMKREGIDFPEAVTLLAEKAGLKPDPTLLGGASGGFDSSDKSAPGLSRRDLYRLNAWALSQYQALFQSGASADAARAYAASRRFSEATLSRFAVGFAPKEWSYLADRATAMGFAADALTTVGLAGRNKSGGLYDVFRGRLLFPIRDTQDRVLGFGGRILPGEADDKSPKYLNTGETPIFSKRRHLFGLDAARDAIVRTRQAVIVEGYTDVMACHQAGIETAVAVLGTALGSDHLALLKRFTDRVVLVLDGDEAGRRRAAEVLHLFLTAEMDVRILTLPGGQDPADFVADVSDQGLAPDAEFARLIAAAPDALDHKLALLTDGLDVARDSHRAHLALEEMLGLLAEIPGAEQVGRARMLDSRGLRIQTTLSRLARTFRLSDEATLSRWKGLTAERSRTRRSGHRPNDSARPPHESPPFDSEGAAGSQPGFEEAVSPLASERTIDAAERELLQGLIAWPDLIDRAINTLDTSLLKSVRARALFEVIERLFFEGESVTFDRLMIEIEDPILKNFLVELDHERQSVVPDYVRGEMTPTTKASLTLARPEDVLTTVMTKLLRRRTDAEDAAQKQRLASGQLDPSDEVAMLERILARRRQQP